MENYVTDTQGFQGCVAHLFYRISNRRSCLMQQNEQKPHAAEKLLGKLRKILNR